MENKKIYTFLLVLMGFVGLLSTSSCSDYLDKEPDTELTMDLVFDNKTKVLGALQYIYGGVPNPARFVVDIPWDTMSDDLTLNKSVNWGSFGIWQRVLGTWTTSNSWSADLWSDYAKRIRQAYLFQDRIHTVDGISEGEVAYMKAECRFLACYYWWNLTEIYGPVPFSTTAYDEAASMSDLMLPRTPFDSIVNYLDKELLAVSKLLPVKYSADEKYGRATSLMCLITRARMLLFAASPLVNGNEWYSSYANNDGTLLFNPTYDQKKWEKAAEACKLVVDEAEAAGYALYTVYNSDGTVDPFLSTQNLYFTLPSAGNNEITFPMTNFNNTNFHTYENLALPNDAGGASILGPYQGLVDAFFMKNGLSAITGYSNNSALSPIINEESGYSETGFSAAIETRNTSWDGGTGVAGQITAKNTFKMYCNREPRFYTSVAFHGTWNVALKRQLDFMYLHSDNTHEWNASRNCYLIRRKVYPKTNEKEGVELYNRPEWLARLATNYLDYAEAVNEAYDNNESRQEAIKYVNKIRVRAGVRQYTTSAVSLADETYIHVDNTRDAIRKIVRLERRVELCCEGVRYSDMRRWKIASDIPEVNGPLVGLNWNSASSETFFKRTENIDQTRVWKKAYYWFPIYIDEVDKNPNLVQSPYWE